MARLTEAQRRMLERGTRQKSIGLSDNWGIRVGEVVALGELERMGLIEPVPKEELPPGPAEYGPHRITPAGRAALSRSSSQ